MKPIYLVVAALPLGVAAAGCDMDLVVVQAEVQEACLTGMAAEFDGVPLPPELGVDVSVSDSFVQDDLGIELPAELSAEAYLTSMALALEDGMPGFSFVKRARLEIAVPNAGDADGDALPPLMLLDIDNSDGAMADPILEVTGNELVDLIDYLRADTLEVTVEFIGRMPEEPWRVDMDMCFEMSGEYRKGLE